MIIFVLVRENRSVRSESEQISRTRPRSLSHFGTTLFVQLIVSSKVAHGQSSMPAGFPTLTREPLYPAYGIFGSPVRADALHL